MPFVRPHNPAFTGKLSGASAAAAVPHQGVGEGGDVILQRAQLLHVVLAHGGPGARRPPAPTAASGGDGSYSIVGLPTGDYEVEFYSCHQPQNINYVLPALWGVTSDPTNPAIQQKALQPYAKSSFILRQQFISRPVWSPDGSQIAYISYDNGTFDLWLANINFDSKTGTYSMKGSPVQLTTGGVDGDSRPFWTP